MDVQGKQIEDDRVSMISRCSQDVASLKKSDVTIIKSFNSPPQAVKETMTAVMILLGHKGKELDWNNVQKQIGKLGEEALQKRVQALDPETIPPETRRKALEVLSRINGVDITTISMATATVHRWAVAVAEY